MTRNTPDNFIEAFGGEDAGQYMFKDQKNFVRDFNSKDPSFNTVDTSGDDTFNDQIDESSQIGQSGRDGEKFQVNVKTLKNKPKDSREKEWIEREMMVTFTSLDDKEKIVQSTLSSLCGGRYASLSSLPVMEVADALSKECDTVFSYADASLAVYSDMIDAQQAFRIARSISEKGIVYHSDYEKILAKLSPYSEKEFDNLIAEARIKIAYPISSVMKTAAPKPDVNHAFYIDYIKETKEYRLGSMTELRGRIASVLSSVDEDTRTKILAEFKKDNILKNF